MMNVTLIFRYSSLFAIIRYNSGFVNTQLLLDIMVDLINNVLVDLVNCELHKKML